MLLCVGVQPRYIKNKYVCRHANAAKVNEQGWSAGQQRRREGMWCKVETSFSEGWHDDDGSYGRWTVNGSTELPSLGKLLELHKHDVLSRGVSAACHARASASTPANKQGLLGASGPIELFMLLLLLHSAEAGHCESKLLLLRSFSATRITGFPNS